MRNDESSILTKNIKKDAVGLCQVKTRWTDLIKLVMGLILAAIKKER